MSEPPTLDGQVDHGVPDPLPLLVCTRCGQPDPNDQYTVIAKRDYCQKCAQHVSDLDSFHQALVGTGEP